MEKRHGATATTIKRIKQICHGKYADQDDEEAVESVNSSHVSSIGAAREKLTALLLPEESLRACHVCLSAPPSMHTSTLTYVFNVSSMLLLCRSL